MELKNKKCLVTGATRGIGKEIETLLEKEGCYVLGVGSKDADLTTYSDIYKLIKLTKKELGNVDILINCAGTYAKLPIEHTTDDMFFDMYNINILAPWMLCRQFIPHMKEQKWGRIVNIGSVASYHGHADQSVYNSSKHALLGLSRSLVKELNDDNIKVMCVSPSGTQTSMGRACIGDQDISTFLEPKEIAEHVVFNLKFDNQLVNTEIRLNRMFISEKEKVM